MNLRTGFLLLALFASTRSAATTDSAGIIIESLGERAATTRAGLRVGDRLLGWERPPAAPGSPEAARGEFRTPFDLDDLLLAQAGRGPVQLWLMRGDERLRIEVPVGDWAIRARPFLDRSIESEYERAITLIDGEEPQAGLDLLLELSGSVEESELAVWMHARRALYHRERAEGELCVSATEAARERAAELDDPVTQYQLRELFFACLDIAGRLDAEEALVRQVLAEYDGRETESLAGAAALDRVALILWYRQEMAATLRISEEVLAIRERLAPQDLETSVALRNLAAAHGMVGNVETAEGYYRRALAIVELSGAESAHMQASLLGLGYIAGKRGQTETSIRYYRKAVALCDEYGCEARSVALNYSYLSAAVEANGDLAEAERLETKALRIRERIDADSQAVATSLGALASIRYRLGKLDGAEEMMDRAFAMQARASGEHSLGVTAIHIDLAKVKLDRGDRAGAREHYEKALAILLDFAPGTISEARTHHLLGQMAREEKRFEAALGYFLDAVRALETQAGNLGGSQRDVAGFRAHYAHLYRDLIELLLQLHRPAEAFKMLERSRAQVLLAMLADRELFFRDAPTQALAESKKEVDSAYGEALARLAALSFTPDASPETREDALDLLAKRRREQHAVHERIRAEAPHLAEIQAPAPLDLEAVQAALPKGTLLLSYLFGPEGGWLFAVTSDPPQLQVHTIDISAEELAGRVKDFRDLVQGKRGRRGVAATKREAAALGELLLAPVAARLATAERILLLPDGPLYLLPFAALGDPGSRERFRYLIEGRPIHLASSATVLARQRGGNRGSGGLVAFGNPSYPSGEPSDAALAKATRSGLSLTPIPATEMEVRGLREIFDDAKIYLGPEATETRARSLSGSPSIIHFAAHGWVDDRFPLESAIALSVPSGSDPGEDNGLLQAWEVFESVRINADLVTLSACDTALGENLAGEGIIGLSRAFQFAGARSVLASLWSVSDRSTAALMDRFYRALAAGSSRDDALRDAQLFLLRDRTLDASAPFYWAAFQLMGDPG